MAKKKKQAYEGVVYSTDSSYIYQDADVEESMETLPPEKQKLRVELDKKARKGKKVSIVWGFVGTDADLQQLARKIKQKCAVGGSVKDGEIIIQGDFTQRIQSVLTEEGYNVKILG